MLREPRAAVLVHVDDPGPQALALGVDAHHCGEHVVVDADLAVAYDVDGFADILAFTDGDRIVGPADAWNPCDRPPAPGPLAARSPALTATTSEVPGFGQGWLTTHVGTSR